MQLCRAKRLPSEWAKKCYPLCFSDSPSPEEFQKTIETLFLHRSVGRILCPDISIGYVVLNEAEYRFEITQVQVSIPKNLDLNATLTEVLELIRKRIERPWTHRPPRQNDFRLAERLTPGIVAG